MGSLFSGSGGQTSSGSSSSTASTNFTPEYNDYVSNILQKAQGLGNTPFPYYDTSTMFAPFSQDQMAAQSMARQGANAWQPYGTAATGALSNVSGYNPMNEAAPFFNRAASGPDPYAAGAGYLSAGAQTWGAPQQQQYSNQFAEGAINRANELSTRNFLEKTMPGINDQFVKSGGGLGRGRYQEFASRAVRDLANEQSGNAQTTMANNYWQGANQFNTDMSRFGQTGAQLGSLAGSSMGALGNLGSQAANVTSGAINSGTGLASAYSGLGGALSNMNQQNAGFLNQMGQQQQQQAQLPLSANYQQFQNAAQWPFQMVNFMNAAQRGLQIPTNQNTQTQQSQSQSASSSASPFGSILAGAGALGSIPGVSDWVGKLFSGGASNVTNTAGAGGASTGANPGNMNYGGGSAQYPQFRRGGAVSRFAQGGPAFGPTVEPRGVLSRRARRFAVGGSVPVVRGARDASMRRMQGRMQGMPPGGALGGAGGPPMGMPPGALGGAGRGLPMPPPPGAGALSMME